MGTLEGHTLTGQAMADLGTTSPFSADAWCLYRVEVTAAYLRAAAWASTRRQAHCSPACAWPGVRGNRFRGHVPHPFGLMGLVVSNLLANFFHDHQLVR